MKLKSLALALLGIAIVAACSLLPGTKPPSGPVGTITRQFIAVTEAQTFPLNKTFVWNASVVDATHAAADSYKVTQNGVTIAAANTTTSIPVSFPGNGVYTFTVTAHNVWGDSPATTLIVTVGPPNAVTGAAIQ